MISQTCIFNFLLLIIQIFALLISKLKFDLAVLYRWVMIFRRFLLVVCFAKDCNVHSTTWWHWRRMNAWIIWIRVLVGCYGKIIFVLCWPIHQVQFTNYWVSVKFSRNWGMSIMNQVLKILGCARLVEFLKCWRCCHTFIQVISIHILITKSILWDSLTAVNDLYLLNLAKFLCAILLKFLLIFTLIFSLAVV